MKKPVYLIHRLRFGLPVVLASLFVLSCAQDPIFHYISLQDRPLEYIIPGSAGRMVVTDDRIYAWTRGGRSVWFFDADGNWHQHSALDHHIWGLAAVGNDLFAAVHIPDDRRGEPPSSRIMRFTAGSWVQVPDAPDAPDMVITNLFSAGGALFAGAQHRRNLNQYDILAFTLSEDPSVTDFLTRHSLAAASPLIGQNSNFALSDVITRNNSVYLATSRGGIFYITVANLAVGDFAGIQDFIPATGLTTITGMIETGGDIVVVGNTERAGEIRVLRGSTPSWIAPLAIPGRFFNGGMGVWRQFDGSEWQPRLLLVGTRTNTGRNNGYMEIHLLHDGRVGFVNPEAEDGVSLVISHQTPGFAGARPEGGVSSVEVRGRYTASIGTRSVRHILQAPPEMLHPGGSHPPGWQPPIFASTSIDGLWVYNPRPWEDQWNAEEGRTNWRYWY